MDFQQPLQEPIQPTLPRFGSNIQKFVLALLVIFAGIVALVFAPPRHFPTGEIISIPIGATSRDVGRLLVDSHVIRSAAAFMLSVEMFDGSSGLQAGDYAFNRPFFVTEIARRIMRGMYSTAQVKLTFPEGISVREMALIIQKQIPNFDTVDFIAKAIPLEGYLFPNTYFVSRMITPSELIDRMKHEFDRQYALIVALDASDISRTQSDIVTMASILEKEANDADEAHIIAGILWKRISRDMPLQVDATFLYRLGKTSSELTLSDLRSNDSYNTYVHRGLPPTPIGNPGADMISAALRPESSPYFYYLHDAQGNVYYAKTFEEHLRNRNKYIQ